MSWSAALQISSYFHYLKVIPQCTLQRTQFVSLFIYKLTEFREVLYKKIDFELLKKVVYFHQEDLTVISILNGLCSNAFKNHNLDKVASFSKYLQTVSKSSNECKVPMIKEETITEKYIVEALKEISVNDSAQVLMDCKEVVDENKDVIEENYLQNKEEATVIASYTYEAGKDETSPYRIINDKLWENSTQDQLINKKGYLRLLLRALRKLPITKPQTLYRGITLGGHEYKVGEEIVWKGFSSTSTNMKVAQNFLKIKEAKRVEGTLFEIRNVWGYDVRDFSRYTEEEGTFKN